MTQAWVIRAGRFGERCDWALRAGCSGGGWGDLPDLTDAQTRPDVQRIVETQFAGAPDGTKSSYTGQLWALRGRISPGDLLVMPIQATKTIALGRVTGGYEYRWSDDPERRHVVSVDWRRTDLPRTAVKQDLLYTLGSAMSIFSPSKNQAVARLERLLATGTDDGQTASHVKLPPPSHDSSATAPSDVDEPELETDIQEVAYDQITSRISEEFAGHDLAGLVTGILESRGLHCIQSPPGPDGGIDIIAGRGVLGLDEPIVVQVKSGAAVGSPVVSELQGVMATTGAKQGLLVSWGGLTKPGHSTLKKSELRIRLWTAKEVVDALLENYEQLSEEVRAKLPLKRVWILTDGA